MANGNRPLGVFAKHHFVPFPTDVLSYTVAGKAWTYPVGAGVIFYLAYLLGGYALISWFGAAACVGTVALLLPEARPAAPPSPFRRTADCLSHCAAGRHVHGGVLRGLLALLWENYRTGRAPLWCLPLIMLVWVNVHFGFVVGLGLIAAYLGVESADKMFSASGRREALQRLRRAVTVVCSNGGGYSREPLGLGNLPGAGDAATRQSGAAVLDRRVDQRARNLERLRHGHFGCGKVRMPSMSCW